MFIYDSRRKFAVNLNTLTSLNVKSSGTHHALEIHISGYRYVYGMPTVEDCVKLLWEIINAYEAGESKVIEIESVALGRE